MNFNDVRKCKCDVNVVSVFRSNKVQSNFDAERKLKKTLKKT